MDHTSLLSCSEVRKHLPDYLNGAVDADTAQQMRWHFGECKDCRMIVRSTVETFRQFFREKRSQNSLHRTHAA